MKQFTGAAIDEMIREEQQKVADKVVELQDLQKQDKEIVDQLKKQYFNAISDGGNTAIDSINEQIKEVSQRIHDTNTKLEVLSTMGNSKIQTVISDAVIAWDDEAKELDEQAQKLHDELVAHHKAVVDGLIQLQQYREKVYSRQSSIERYASMLSEDSKEAIVYPSSFSRVDIVKYMQPLLITQYVKR